MFIDASNHLFTVIFILLFTDVGVECTVPVLLDGEESIIDFIDIPDSDVSIRTHLHK